MLILLPCSSLVPFPPDWCFSDQWFLEISGRLFHQNQWSMDNVEVLNLKLNPRIVPWLKWNWHLPTIHGLLVSMKWQSKDFLGGTELWRHKEEVGRNMGWDPAHFMVHCLLTAIPGLSSEPSLWVHRSIFETIPNYVSFSDLQQGQYIPANSRRIKWITSSNINVMQFSCDGNVLFTILMKTSIIKVIRGWVYVTFQDKVAACLPRWKHVIFNTLFDSTLGTSWAGAWQDVIAVGLFQTLWGISYLSYPNVNRLCLIAECTSLIKPQFNSISHPSLTYT